MTHTFTAVLTRDGKWFVAHCPELGVTSQGKTLDDSLANLKEAVTLFLHDEDISKIPGCDGRHPLVTSFEVSV